MASDRDSRAVAPPGRVPVWRAPHRAGKRYRDAVLARAGHRVLRLDAALAMRDSEAAVALVRGRYELRWRTAGAAALDPPPRAGRSAPRPVERAASRRMRARQPQRDDSRAE